MDVRLPDGTVLRNVPDGTTKEQLRAKLAANGHDVQKMGLMDDVAPKGYVASRLDEAKDAINGVALGVSDIGNTVLNVATAPVGKLIPSVAQWNRTRNADFDAITEQNKGSKAFTGGRLAGNIAATLPVGGALGAGLKTASPLLLRAGASAPVVEGLTSALASGGFRAGALTGATKAATRSAGGALAGAASAGLIDPNSAGTGALVGGALPMLAPVAGYLGSNAKALLQPFTAAGRDSIAGGIINRFAQGGPTAMNAAEIVPGSLPTLAEATGNAGIARLQSAARDVAPNPFALRERGNAGARNALFDNVAGNRLAIQSAKDSRDQVGDALYGQAFTADSMRQNLATGAQQTRSPFTGVGLSGGREDLATPGLRELMSRPAFKQAANAARTLAKDRGADIGDPLQSLEGLHYIKLALDDALNPAAASAMGRNASGAIMSMRDKLTDELAKVSPLYGGARQQFAEMSKPINAMEFLQDLNLTDKFGNITSAKIQNAIDGYEKLARAPGVNNAKSVTPEQLNVLKRIRDDLMRQDNVAAGKSAGSNTFQNIATDNILSNMLPGQLGSVINGKVGDVVGQIGKLAYSGPNEKIRNRLAEMMLDPSSAQAAMTAANAPRVANPLVDKFGETLYRVAPVLPANR